MPSLRIDKILSSQNLATRKEASLLARSGRISLNGNIIRSASEKCDPETDDLRLDGKPVCYKEHLYLMMNKPAGILSASRDSRTETVIDLLPPEFKRKGLFPAGRLDKDTTGFLLITDDGDLAHRMLSPASHVRKLYQVVCDRELSENDVRKFASGISEGGDHFRPAGLKLTGGASAIVEICEGKYHQIKRMFHAVGAEVIKLKRISIGEVYLDESLSPGQVRELKNEEISMILSLKKEL